MKQVMNNPPANRIDDLSRKWEARKQGYVATYGQAVLGDREFIRANRAVYNQILRELPYNTLTFDEKISYRIMRGQARHLNAVLYPNPLVRAMRNIVVLVGKLLNNLLKHTTGTEGLSFQWNRRVRPNRSLITPPVSTRQEMPVPQQMAGPDQRTTAELSGPAVSSSKSLTPSVMEEVVPKRYKVPRVVVNNTQSQGQSV